MSLETIPLFPLGLVAFPEEQLNLHIFEPRYRQLVQECFEEEKTFGITPYTEGSAMEVGTEMEIVEISKIYDDGKMDIKTRGKRVFKVVEVYSRLGSKLYPGAEVEFIEEKKDAPSLLEFQAVVELIKQLYDLTGVNAPLPEWDEGFTIYEIAHKLGLDFKQELALLKIRNEADRIDYIKQHLEIMIPVVSQIEELKTRVKMNGHFKNIIPPETFKGSL